MSRIVGVLQRQGQPVAPEMIDRMLDHLTCLDHQIAPPWTGPSIGLGHSLLITTPEFQQLPWTDPQTQLTITADARLDNREELCEHLDLDPERPDSHLILAAYRRWHQDCPQRLLGDFAFAIWDPHQHYLFCARDPLGVKPFYYYLSTDRFVFASEVRGVVAGPQVPHRLNPTRVADYWVQQRGGSLAAILDDHHLTLYQDTVPLRAGHWLIVSPDRIHRQQYWQLDPDYELRLKDDREYAEGFRERFIEAVRCRLRSSTPVGIQLSGGLDSSSIACTARQIHPRPPLLAFSAIFPHLRERERRRLDERSYLQDVLDQGDITSQLFAADQISPLRDVRSLDDLDPPQHWHEDECCFTPTTYLNRITCRLARSVGCRVVLDGLDGDGVVGHGFMQLRLLAQQGRWLELAPQIRAVVNAHQNPWISYGRYLWGYGLAPHLLRGPLRWGWNRYQQQSRVEIPELIHPDLAQAVDLKARIKTWRHQEPHPKTFREEHLQIMTCGLMQCALHMSDKVSASLGIEARHPFFDRRLVEYCLSLPIEQRIQQGWSRWVLRQAMTGILPPSIQWRRGKAKLGAGALRGLYLHERGYLTEQVERGIERLEGIVQPESIRQAHQQVVYYGERQEFGRKEMSLYAYQLWTHLTLAYWLEQTGLRLR